MSIHSLTRLFVHVVWTTLYRLPTLTPDDDARLHVLLGDAVAAVDSELVAAGNASDRVHALVRVSPKVSIATLAQRLKRRTSYFGSWSWQRGYFAELVSIGDVDVKASYHQRHHHPNRIESESAEGGL